MIPLVLACIAISGGSDRITAADLGLDGPSASSVVALAPIPGVRRIFRVAELQRLAVRFHSQSVPEHDVCIERRSSPLDAARIVEAMQRHSPDARIELLDYSRVHVPDGEIEFPLTGLHGGLWNGFVRYAGGRRFLIWAKVQVQVSCTRLVAVEALKPGQLLEASNLRVETRNCMPSAAGALSVDDVAGKVLRRSVAAGAEIQKLWLAAPLDVSRGDTVRVEVHSGAAVLAFEGTAEAGGTAGQTIAVLNPTSKKRFQARIEGKGRVSAGNGTL